MPLLHCKKCHHEFEASRKGVHCDWCGGHSYVLQEHTDLEKLIDTIKCEPLFWFNMLKKKGIVKLANERKESKVNKAHFSRDKHSR